MPTVDGKIGCLKTNIEHCLAVQVGIHLICDFKIYNVPIYGPKNFTNISITNIYF